MRVVALRSIAVFIALVAVVQLGTVGSLSQATPEPEQPLLSSPEPEQSLRTNLPPEMCSSGEIDAGNTQIVEKPSNAAQVQPGATPGRYLYLVELTLPPGTCLGYAYHYLHDGAIVWYVQQGQIEFAAQRIGGLPAPLISAGHVDGTQFPITSMPVTLATGDWLALDRPGEYTYRNTSTSADAVVLMAVNETDPFATSVLRGCKGSCKKG